MPIRLIGLDIDGTLLNSRKQMSARSRAAGVSPVASIRFRSTDSWNG